MSGRIRRLLRTVPRGGVALGDVAKLAATASPQGGGGLSPAQSLAGRLLAERLAGVAPDQCMVIGPGRLVAAATLPFACHMVPLAKGDGSPVDRDARHWLVVGDALAGLDDPPASLERLVQGLGPKSNLRLIVVLPGTALLPDDLEPCPRRWLFSRASATAMASQVLGASRTSVVTLGNVLAASSELLGLPADRLWPEEINADDPQYPMVVAIEARLGAH